MDNVYEPREDSYLLVHAIDRAIRKSKKKALKVLDVGTGSGILAKRMKELLPKGKVFALDISKEAAKKVKGVNVIVSDLFSGIKEKFDLIVFNPPYLPADMFPPDLQTIGGKKGYETISRFVHELPEHLKKDGVCLFVISSLTSPKKVERFLEESGLVWEIAEEKKLFFETLYVYSVKRA